MIVRKLLDTDYNEYISLINEFRSTFFTKEQFIKKLQYMNNYSDIWVIQMDDKLIATATIIYEQKFIYNLSVLAHIEDVCVRKEYRGQGYGLEIIKKLIEEARKFGCYKITLDCSDINENFYVKNNFEKRGIQMSQLL